MSAHDGRLAAQSIIALESASIALQSA